MRVIQFSQVDQRISHSASMSRADVWARRARTGFTLVELLVGLALVIFIMSLFSVLFVEASRGMQQMRGITAVDQNVRTVTTILRRDLKDVILNTQTQGIIKPHQLYPRQAPGTGGAGNYVPNGGYFMIEENSPALRQGIDQWGRPVEIDIDDVIGFTVRRRGDSPEELFYGRVPVGNFLDNFGEPRSRYDEINNGIFSSQVAEVVYFLRPDKRQFNADELRGHATDGTAVTSTLENNPPTFTLYRRQLLVVPDTLATQINSSTAAQRVTAGFTSTDFYNRFDVSAKPDPSLTAGGAMFVNMFQDPNRGLQIRSNRYGLNWQANAAGTAVLLNDYPYSWSSKTAGYGSFATASIFNVNVANAQWLGRPITLETNATSATSVFTNLRNLYSAIDVDSTMDGLTDRVAPFTAVNNGYIQELTVGYEYASDILLKNVLSFDIKVLDEDPRTEPTRENHGLPRGGETITSGPGAGNFHPGPGNTAPPGSPLPIQPIVGTSNIGVIQRGTIAVNPLRGTNLATDHTNSEFVDLGFSGNPDRLADNQLIDNLYSTAVPDTDYPFIPDSPLPLPGGTPGQQGNPNKYYDYNIAVARGELWGPAARFRNTGRYSTIAPTGPVAPPNGAYRPRNTYDSWSNTYAPNGVNARPVPYPKPLQAIQITIRQLDPRSGVVRESIIVHKFAN